MSNTEKSLSNIEKNLSIIAKNMSIIAEKMSIIHLRVQHLPRNVQHLHPMVQHGTDGLVVHAISDPNGFHIGRFCIAISSHPVHENDLRRGPLIGRPTLAITDTQPKRAAMIVRIGHGAIGFFHLPK